MLAGHRRPAISYIYKVSEPANEAVEAGTVSVTQEIGTPAYDDGTTKREKA